MKSIMMAALGASIVLLALVVSAPPSAPHNLQVINITEVGIGNVSQLVKVTRCDVIIPLPQEPDKYSFLRGVVVCIINGKRWQTTVDTIPPEWAGKSPSPVRSALSDDEWLVIFGKHLCTQNQTRYLKNNTTFIEECDWMDGMMPSGRGALGLVKRTWRINETGWASFHSGAWPKDGITEKRWQ